MADNTSITPGAGEIISTDDLGGGVKVQRVKIQYGADASATDILGANAVNGTNGTGLLADGPMHQEAASGLWRPFSTAGADALNTLTLPAAGNAFYNQGTGNWDRARSASLSEGNTPVGVQAVMQYALDNAGLVHRVRTPDSDARPTNYQAASNPVTFNGSTFDRQRGNTEGTLLASAARTSTTTSAVQTNHNGRGVKVVLGVTVAGTGNLQPRVLDTANGNYVTAAPTGITGTGEYVYEVYPGASTAVPGAGAANTVQRTAAALARSWYAQIVHSDASSWTYSVTYSLIV